MRPLHFKIERYYPHELLKTVSDNRKSNITDFKPPLPNSEYIVATLNTMLEGMPLEPVTFNIDKHDTVTEVVGGEQLLSVIYHAMSEDCPKDVFFDTEHGIFTTDTNVLPKYRLTTYEVFHSLEAVKRMKEFQTPWLDGIQPHYDNISTANGWINHYLFTIYLVRP